MNAKIEHTGPVTTRALGLLEAFAPDKPVLCLSELARRAGLPISTAHRLAADLLAWGALEREERGGGYRIGLRLWEIASLAPRGTMLRELALPVMEDLAHITRENIQLGVREEHDLVFIERIRSSGSVPLLSRVGGRFTLSATGVGLALLAYAPAEVQADILAQPIVRFTDHTITDPTRLRKILADIRQTGVAISDRQITLDTLSVAAPIFDSSRAVRAAISIVVDARTARRQTLVPLVQTAALNIGRALGHNPRPTHPAH